MLKFYLILATLICGFARLAAVESQSATQPELKGEANAKLIELMAAEDYATREAAMGALWHRGEKAFPLIESAAKNNRSPEIRHRAKLLVRYISTGLKKEVLEQYDKQIQKFKDMKDEEQLTFLTALHDQRHYALMFFLLNKLENPDLIESHLNHFDNLPEKAARTLVAAGHYQGALESLRCLPNSNYKTKLAMAHVISLQGKLEEELMHCPEKPQNDEQRHWKLALLMQKRDIAALRAFQKQENLQFLPQLLDFIEGNAYPLLANMAPDKVENKEAIKMFLKLHRNAQTQPDQGYLKQLEKELLPLLTKNKKRKFDARLDYLLPIYLQMRLLKTSSAEFNALVKEYYKDESVEYLLRSERPLDALAVLGITDAESRKKYVNHWVGQLHRETRMRREARERLTQLAIFYQERGESEIVWSILDATSKKIKDAKAADGAQAVAEHLLAIYKLLMQEDEPALAVEFFLKLNDPILLKKYLETYPNHRNIFEELKMIEKDSLKRFRVFALLLGYVPEQYEEQQQIQAKWMEKIKDSDVKQKLKHLELLTLAASNRNDTQSLLKIIPQMRTLKKQDKWRPDMSIQPTVLQSRLDEYYILALEAGMQHQKHVDFCQQHYELIRERPRRLTAYAISLKHLGNTTEANKQLEQAWAVTMGNVDQQRAMLGAFLTAHEHELAIQFADRMLFSVDASSPMLHTDLIGLVELLSDVYPIYMKKKRFADVRAMAALQINTKFCYANSDFQPVQYIYTHHIMQYYFGSLAGIRLQEGKWEEAKQLLRKAYDYTLEWGGSADGFFEFMRSTPYQDLYDACVGATVEHYEKRIKAFPKSASTQNSLAWLLSRAVKKLDRAEQLSVNSLLLSKGNPAYLDTMAEIQFSKKNREKAIEYSLLALQNTVSGKNFGVFGRRYATYVAWNMNKQLLRFRNDAFPTNHCVAP